MIECVIEDENWQDLAIADLAERAFEATLAHLDLADLDCSASLLATDDARIALLNERFRGKPAATNVLSWPSADRTPARPGERPAPPIPDRFGECELGDIALAWAYCAAEAQAANKPLADHVTHLIVHGTLHLLGFDHEDERDATLMEGLEIEILGNLGLDDPYRLCR